MWGNLEIYIYHVMHNSLNLVIHWQFKFLTHFQANIQA